MKNKKYDFLNINKKNDFYILYKRIYKDVYFSR